MTWASKNRGVHATYDDDEVEHTGCGGGEGTTGAAGASIVIEGDKESNGSLGDGGWERNGNTGLPRLGVDAATANTEAGCTISPASAKVGRASALEGAGTRAR